MILDKLLDRALELSDYSTRKTFHPKRTRPAQSKRGVTAPHFSTARAFRPVQASVI